MKRTFILFFFLVSICYLNGAGQAGIDYDIKKPPKYENRKLGSEKTYETKFKVPRHFIQNTVTHYNYYFNANNKLNEVVNRAKSQNRDDYTKLLPFYNYSLDATATLRRDLDSIIAKCNMSILVHDLRNDWVDNLYMLMGRAYYLRKDMDSAAMIFQFINYAFAPKDADNYWKPIGSNANAEEGGNNFIVSTNEKRNIVKRTFSLPPSRNESLVWQVRTYITKNDFGKAAALIDILLHDPQFPERLRTDLEEMQALFFYQQKIYDSAAIHLEKALPNAATRLEQARWEFLIGQLYDRAGQHEKAREFFERSVQHTYDPVMDVYGRLNAIKQNQSGSEDYIQKNIEALNKLARKEVYAEYRDVIYYTAAQMELQRNRKPAAVQDLLKSVKYSQPMSVQGNLSFMMLADLAYEDRSYKTAKRFYDSVNSVDPAVIGDPSLYQQKKKALEGIVKQLEIVERQDSLTRIANMPAEERTAYVKKLAKTLRRQQGLGEEGQAGGAGPGITTSTNAVQDMFSSSDAGTWYFYNSSVKAKGFNDFKSRWGSRQNVDNWQVSSMASRQSINSPNGQPLQGNALPDKPGSDTAKGITFQSLMDNLPLTPEKIRQSQDSVENALFALGTGYQNELPDYYSAIHAYDSLLTGFPSTHYREEALFNLYFCYKKIGDEQNAARVLAELKQRFPNGKPLHLIENPNAVEYSENAARIDATKRYEKVYTAFIEGSFDQAIADKKTADSLYGEKYWTPQLMYIEAVYYIHERQDDKAKTVLMGIISKFNGTPMAEKAKNIINVLGRRKQIEDYLTNLKVTRATDDSTASAAATPRPMPAEKKPEPVSPEDTVQARAARISGIAANDKAKNAPVNLGNGKLNPGQAQKVEVHVDPAELARLRKQSDSITNALAKAEQDAAAKAALKKKQDSINTALAKLRADSATAAAARIASLKSNFVYTPDQPHAVAVVMVKVDPIYVTEAKNAFSRYDRENYYNKPLDLVNAAVNDTVKLVLIRGFANASEAIDYTDKAKKLAPSEILPWLPAAKYSFLIITDQNLGILQNNQDIPAYRQFLQAYFPGKF